MGGMQRKDCCWKPKAWTEDWARGGLEVQVSDREECPGRRKGLGMCMKSEGEGKGSSTFHCSSHSGCTACTSPLCSLLEVHIFVTYVACLLFSWSRYSYTGVWGDAWTDAVDCCTLDCYFQRLKRLASSKKSTQDLRWPHSFTLDGGSGCFPSFEPHLLLAVWSCCLRIIHPGLGFLGIPMSISRREGIVSFHC